jgi:hypothetical protein
VNDASMAASLMLGMPKIDNKIAGMTPLLKASLPHLKNKVFIEIV